MEVAWDSLSLEYSSYGCTIACPTVHDGCHFVLFFCDASTCAACSMDGCVVNLRTDTCSRNVVLLWSNWLWSLIDRFAWDVEAAAAARVDADIISLASEFRNELHVSGNCGFKSM